MSEQLLNSVKLKYGAVAESTLRVAIRPLRRISGQGKWSLILVRAEVLMCSWRPRWSDQRAAQLG